MQIQRTNGYTNSYSSNRVQQSSAKNPNFGMKLVYDEADLVRTVGQENLGNAKELIQRLQDGLVSRFKSVFMMNSRKYDFLASQEGVKEVLDDSGKLIPEKAIEGWGIDELMATTLRRKGTYHQVDAEFLDGKAISGFGEGFSFTDPVQAMEKAYDEGLDRYAENKIFMSLASRLRS